MKKQPSEFKKLVQMMLKDRGMKQKTLAKKMSLSDSALSHLLSRDTNDEDTMKLIAQILNFDVSLFNSNSQIKTHGSTFQPGQKVDKDCEEQLEYMKKLLDAKDDIIRSKDDLIAALRQRIEIRH